MVNGASKRSPIAALTKAQRRWLITRSILRATGSAVALVLIYYLLPVDRGSREISAVGVIMGGAVLVGITAWQVRAILSSTYPTLRAIEALAVIVPLVLLTFAETYFAMARTSAANFSQPLTRTDSLYFAITVFSTVGFGDITPRTEASRVVVMIQMLADIAAIGLGVRVVAGAVNWAREREPSTRA
jgi:voltage-gated potassium channel